VVRKPAVAVLIAALIVTGALMPVLPAEAKDYSPGMPIPAKGMATMLDIGAATCIPCKMMAPILEKLVMTYRGKAMIIYLDVRYHREKAIGFGINGIPTQIFFDKNGKEVYRHIGFMNEAAIVAQYKKMGVE